MLQLLLQTQGLQQLPQLPYYAILAATLVIFPFAWTVVTSAQKKLKEKEVAFDANLEREITEINIKNIVKIYTLFKKFDNDRIRARSNFRFTYYGNVGIIAFSLLGSILTYYNINSQPLYFLAFLGFGFSLELFLLGFAPLVHAKFKEDA